MVEPDLQCSVFISFISKLSFSIYFFSFFSHSPVQVTAYSFFAMYYPCLVALFGLAAGVHSHGVILAVAGEKGSPDSQGFLGKSI